MAADPVLPASAASLQGDAALPPGSGVAAAAPAPQVAVAESVPVAAPAAAPSVPAVEAGPAAIIKPAAAAEVPAAEPKLEPTLLEKFDTAKVATDKLAADTAAAKIAVDKAAEKPKAEAKPDAKAEAKPGDAEKDKTKVAADAAKAAADKLAADAAAAAEAAKPAAVEYKYTLPDTLKMDDGQKTRFHTVLDEFRADPAANVQKLVDLHQELMSDFAAQTTRNQFDVFNKTKNAWETKVMGDQELGGAGHDTAMQAVARARDATISSAKPDSKRFQRDMAEYKEFLAVTGAGSHPAYIRQLHNMARYVDEPQAGEAPLNDLKPPKNAGKAPGSRIYDHPSSQKAMR